MTLPYFPHAQPLEGLAGGIMIGIAAAIMLLGLGRIAGVSGLAARSIGLSDAGPPRIVAMVFIAGLILGALAFQGVIGPIESTYPPSMGWLIAGGLITGFGTRLGSGCTSGHGVCGMSRLSRRSIVAVVTFIGSGMVTVAIVNLAGGGW
uniref:YeeE/YedE family protein n=1 Tax=uncultured Altererythrobacter sp. TaxID=500840 RepID=UPI00261BDF06|nr:YeeE/YedE thiosulfate transporter family protein [uncultured Altererythrobacter sp.]